VSGSPFISPGTGRRRRRAPWLRWAAAGAALAAAVAAAVVLLGGGSSPARGHRPRTAARVAAHAPATGPRLSPDGLPLATPALALRGIGDPAADAVSIHFHHPPRSGLLFDLDSGRVLWQRAAERQVPIASLTKMMTALLAVRSIPPDGLVRVTRAAIATNGSKVGVLPLGRHIPVRTMLYGLLLPSGNDAAVALAQRAAGSVGRFVDRMNHEAARLGLGCTRFSSPSGYYDQGNFSCPADLAVLAHADLEQPRIASVTRTYSAVLPFPIKGGKLYLYNNNPLLIYGYPGTTGLKTGYTEASGRCLVATAERDGVRLGVIVLDSDAPGTQAKQLLDRAFEHVYHLPRAAEQPMPKGA